MFRTTSAEWTPFSNASEQASSTASRPSVSTAPRISTICRSPPGCRSSLRCTRRRAGGRSQPLDGAFATGLEPVATSWLTAQCTGLAGQNRDVVERAVDRPAAAEGPVMPARDLTVLPELQVIGVGAGLDGPPGRAGGTPSMGGEHPRSNGSCRSARGRSWRRRRSPLFSGRWRPVSRRHGSHRTGRHWAQGSDALLRTRPRPSGTGCHILEGFGPPSSVSRATFQHLREPAKPVI